MQSVSARGMGVRAPACSVLVLNAGLAWPGHVVLESGVCDPRCLFCP